MGGRKGNGLGNRGVGDGGERQRGGGMEGSREFGQKGEGRGRDEEWVMEGDGREDRGKRMT